MSAGAATTTPCTPAGDALGVIPRCPPELVEQLISTANFSGDELVETHLGEATLKEALTDHLEIHRISKKWIQNLGSRMADDGPVEIRIARRHRVSTEDGSLLVDWSGSGEAEMFQKVTKKSAPPVTLLRHFGEA